MKVLSIFAACLLVLVVFFVLWYVVSDYSDGVASGSYHFARTVKHPVWFSNRTIASSKNWVSMARLGAQPGLGTVWAKAGLSSQRSF